MINKLLKYVAFTYIFLKFKFTSTCVLFINKYACIEDIFLEYFTRKGARKEKFGDYHSR